MKPTGDRKERPQLAWDKAKIIAALRARQDECLEMHYGAVHESDSRLCAAMGRYFGSFDEALRAAGVDPAAERKRIRWDRDAIVAALRDHRAKGLPMRPKAVERSNPRLSDAIRRYFTSFNAALRAAGVELDAPAPPHVLWDRARIIAALADRRSRGLPLNTGAIQKSDSALAGAIYKRFHSHDAALLAAGIDRASVRKASPWDKARVVAALRARRDAGMGLSMRVIAREDMPLSGGIARCFGTCDAAVRAAGIDPDVACQRVRRWSKDGILDALLRRQAKGLAMNAGAVSKSRSGLYVATSHHFGSYDAALRAAGIDPDPLRQRRPDWDRQQILKAVQARRDKGLGVHGTLGGFAVRGP